MKILSRVSPVTHVKGVALCMPILAEARKYAEDREEYRDRHHAQNQSRHPPESGVHHIGTVEGDGTVASAETDYARDCTVLNENSFPPNAYPIYYAPHAKQVMK
jgi:hypothetical protein